MTNKKISPAKSMDLGYQKAWKYLKHHRKKHGSSPRKKHDYEVNSQLLVFPLAPFSERSDQ